MSFDTIFGKSAKSAVLEFKTMAQQMISNGCNFSCQCLNISTIQDESTVYPDAKDLDMWVQNLLIEETKSKPLNPKAVEEMKKKGLTPKKQISELILVAIIPSATHIHVGISIPPSMIEDIPINPKDFVSNALDSYEFDLNVKDSFTFASIVHPESLKERDTVLRYFFAELKRLKIYVEDEEEDEINFTL